MSETGALTLGPSLSSATAAPQPSAATRGRPVVPYRQRCSPLVFTGPQGGSICIFTTMQMRRGTQRDLEAKQTAQQLGQKREGGQDSNPGIWWLGPAPEPPPHQGWEPSRGSVDCRG